MGAEAGRGCAGWVRKTTFWVFGIRGGARACWVGCVCVGRMGGWRGHCNNIGS